jgi:preprotein translocase subunit SecA
MVAEPNLSGRCDRQLVGRGARQGDPGSSQVFMSADDAAICRFAPSLSRRMKRLANSAGEVSVDLSRSLRRLQRLADANGAAQRRQQYLHDDGLEKLVMRLSGARPSNP